MQKFTVLLLVGMVLLAISSFSKAQEIHMYGPRGAGIGIPPMSEGADGGGESTAEVQDEAELASALGIDRRALYEDLMRIQEELGGSPLSGPDSGGPPPLVPLVGEQNSQEQDDDY